MAVKVLDAEAQLRLSRQNRRYDLMINLLLVAIYLALLFALLGGLAHAFWLWSGQAAWR